nr:DNA-directed DNA polymerase [Tanacetum cinerariifolium]
MLRACPHHRFTELIQIDTFYNGLNENDQDSLNAAAGGNLLSKTTREALHIIKNKSKVRYSRNKPNVSRMITTSKENASKMDDRIDKLADQISTLVDIVSKKVVTPTTVKAVEESCVTCGGNHAYYNCDATNRNQLSVCTVAVVDFEANPRVPLILGRSFLRIRRALIDLYGEEITLRVNDEAVTFNLNQTTRYSSTYDDMSINRIDIIDVAREEYAQKIVGIEAYLKVDSLSPEIDHADCDPKGDICLIKNLLNDDPFQLPPVDLKQGEVVTVKSSIEEPSDLELKDLPSHLEYAYLEGVDKLPVIIAKVLKVDEKEALLKVLKSHKRAIAWKITDIKGIDPRFYTYKILMEEDYNPQYKVKDGLTQKFMIFADALLLMPKFASTIKSLLTNKDKLFELAKVPLNENYSAILLKKLPKKLGDPDKFLIPCDFLGMDVCHALADLADRSITHPKGVVEHVFIEVGKFHFPTDFVVVDFEADPRVPLILGRSFLRTDRALIDVYGKEITLWVNDESVTFNLNQTMRYSFTYDDSSVNRIDVIDIACEEYAQDVLDFKYNSKSGNLTLVSNPSFSEETKSEFCKEPIVKSSSATLTPFGENQEKTTFTCPYGTFAYRRMPFDLCNAPGTFQRYMMAIFYDMIEKTMEVFMDDFSVFGSLSSCLSYLDTMLQRCEDTNLVLNWEKYHFMVKEGIVLGHKILKNGLEVDRAKVDVIAKLPHPTIVKDCIDAFGTLKKKLTEASILVVPDWNLPFELMCDASDFAIGAVLGQRKMKYFQPIHYANKTMTEA